MGKTTIIRMKKKGTSDTLYPKNFFCCEDSTECPVIPNATVTCAGRTLTTGLNGLTIHIFLPAGTHNFTATHPDYETTTGNFTLP